jgi:hypothetical protein
MSDRRPPNWRAQQAAEPEPYPLTVEAPSGRTAIVVGPPELRRELRGRTLVPAGADRAPAPANAPTPTYATAPRTTAVVELQSVALELLAEPKPRRFELHRDVDATGVSGTGVVADGWALPSGAVVVQWRGDRPSVVAWPAPSGMEHVGAIHGPGGLTRIVWVNT